MFNRAGFLWLRVNEIARHELTGLTGKKGKQRVCTCGIQGI